MNIQWIVAIWRSIWVIKQFWIINKLLIRIVSWHQVQIPPFHILMQNIIGKRNDKVSFKCIILRNWTVICKLKWTVGKFVWADERKFRARRGRSSMFKWPSNFISGPFSYRHFDSLVFYFRNVHVGNVMIKYCLEWFQLETMWHDWFFFVTSFMKPPMSHSNSIVT